MEQFEAWFRVRMFLYHGPLLHPAQEQSVIPPRPQQYTKAFIQHCGIYNSILPYSTLPLWHLESVNTAPLGIYCPSHLTSLYKIQESRLSWPITNLPPLRLLYQKKEAIWRRGTTRGAQEACLPPRKPNAAMCAISTLFDPPGWRKKKSLINKALLLSKNFHASKRRW